jgi:acyl dehydratase
MTPIYLEDIPLGAWVELGRYTFTRDAIMDYARRFDPQPFHLSEDAAEAGLFGALSASGWHTAAVWMKLQVARLTREASQGRVLMAGPSPGVTGMKWLKPVLVGDTLDYATKPVSRRPSASRPGWGLLSSENRAINQHGETVFEFNGAVFVQARPAG